MMPASRPSVHAPAFMFSDPSCLSCSISRAGGSTLPGPISRHLAAPGLGTLENGAGEVIGLKGEFWAADPTDPVPRKLTDETSPSGVMTSFFPTDKMTISTTVNLEALQTLLDERFVDTQAFAYLFSATGRLTFVEYQPHRSRSPMAISWT